MPVHIQELVGVALLKLVLFGDRAVRELFVYVDTDTVVRRA